MKQKKYTGPLDLKADTEGTFRATFAAFNVVDHDGDVTTPGAFEANHPVLIAGWGHNWAGLTVGKGTVHADGKRAWVDGQFNLNTVAGREHYETVKFNGPNQEWSYGFQIDKWSVGQFEGKEVRFLEKLTPFEVSPVMVAAGIGTQTDFIKMAKDAEAIDAKMYSIAERGDEFCVVDDDTGDTVACHPTRQEAVDHQQALMGTMEDAGKADVVVIQKTLTLSDAGLSLLSDLKALMDRMATADVDTLQQSAESIVVLRDHLTQAQDQIAKHLERAWAKGPTAHELKRRFEELTRLTGAAV